MLEPTCSVTRKDSPPLVTLFPNMSKDEMLKDAGKPAPARDTPVPKLKHDCANAEKGDTTTENPGCGREMNS